MGCHINQEGLSSKSWLPGISWMSHSLSALIFSFDQWGWESPSCRPHGECKMNLRGYQRCEKEWRSIKCMGLVWENKASESAWQARLLIQRAGRTQRTTVAFVGLKQRPLLSGINYPQGRGVRAVCSQSGLLGHLTLWDINSQDSLVIFNLHQCLFFQFCPSFFSTLEAAWYFIGLWARRAECSYKSPSSLCWDSGTQGVSCSGLKQRCPKKL